MNLSRREFLELLAAASTAGLALTGCDGDGGGKSAGGAKPAKGPSDLYEVPSFGNVSFLHFTDCHAQLNPVYFREPSINLGLGEMRDRPPHLVGEHLLRRYGIEPGTPLAHAFTYLNFEQLAERYGKVGGFAHLATLVKRLREQRPGSLLLDGGDTWQGSATSLWTDGQDMIDAQLLLGVDVMTAHWEFTFGEERVREVLENDFKGKIDFVAQNVLDTDWGEPVFDPYVTREMNGVPVAIIGQAFPYTSIANPQYQFPSWSFQIRDGRMQQVVDKARDEGAQAVVLLSHNGMDVDLKMARQVSGIDAILGGHTHDAMPGAMEMKNSGGTTLVINSGSNGKFLSVLDLDVREGGVRDYQYRLLPVFSDMLDADPAMAEYVRRVREPFRDRLEEPLATAGELLYRRGNFNGTFDQVICDALRNVMDTEIAFSPGFRWGVSVLPGETITAEHLMTQTAITYPEVTVSELTGKQIKDIMEDVADNLFNKDPYKQQGGDMVRTGGLSYAIDPTARIGERITDMQVNGEWIDLSKTYKVAGWANVNQPQDGQPVWEVVKEYLKDRKTAQIEELNTPTLKNVSGNPGLGKIHGE